MREIKDMPTVLAAIEYMALSQPDNAAVIGRDFSLTFRSLIEEARRMSHVLRARGIAPGSVVGIHMDRSPQLIAALLAVWMVRCPYTILDKSLPAARRAFIYNDATVRVVLTDTTPERGAPEASLTCLDMSDFDVHAQVDDASLLDVSEEDLAYICYTSGSTGVPKGVQVSHNNLRYYVSQAVGMYLAAGMGPTPIQQPLNFDGSVTSLWPPLVAGLAVSPMPSGASTIDLVRFLEERHLIGILKVTPSQFRAMEGLLRDDVLLALQGTIVFGGEQLFYSDIACLRGLYPQVRIFNQYGPTETTVASLAHEVLPSDPYSGDVPIGRPMEGTVIKLLHSADEGGPSELLIGGPGVTRGYLNRSDETAARFTEEQVEGVSQRFYRTGDLVHLDVNSRLVFAGRRDNQVKRHGFRIEIGEIEGALKKLKNVKDAIVIAKNEKIHAFVVTDGERITSIAAKLSIFLPVFMMPDTITKLDAIPITDRGKTDTQALERFLRDPLQ
jgi:amino acid adenylation domain-containing protein